MAITAFIAKLDFANLKTVDNGLVVKDESPNGSNQVVRAPDQSGNIIAYNVFGVRSAPSVNYELGKDLTAFDVVLGTVNTVATKLYLFKQLDIKTSQASAVTMSAVCEELPTGSSASCTIDFGSITLKKLHKAQFITDSITLGGTGANLQTCDITFKCNPTFAEVEGAIIAHDIAGGEITQVITILQTGSAIPTVAAGTGWEITETLKRTSNPDGNYPMWTCTLSKFVASTEPA
jgi:hypothetical protein